MLYDVTRPQLITLSTGFLWIGYQQYGQISNISHTKFQNSNVSRRFAVVFSQSTEANC